MSSRKRKATDQGGEKAEKEDVKQTWTVTWSDAVENHAGMQMLGKMAPKGFSVEQVQGCVDVMTAKGCACEVIDLEQALPQHLRTSGSRATLGIIRKGTTAMSSSNNNNDSSAALHEEIKSSRKIVDKQAFMRGRVVNKRARYNLCYGEQTQEPDYANKKGRVVAFSSTPELNHVRKELGVVFGDDFKGLLAELNYYYDHTSTGIGFHGDGERRRVVGMRVGDTMDLQYQWYHKGEPVGTRVTVSLADGDMYVMSDKTVGTDWKKRNVPTLRHAAGAAKFTTITQKKKQKSA